MGHPHSLTNDFWVYVSWVLGKGSGTLSFWAKCGLSFHVLEFLSCWVFAILLKKKPGYSHIRAYLSSVINELVIWTLISCHKLLLKIYGRLNLKKTQLSYSKPFAIYAATHHIMKSHRIFLHFDQLEDITALLG